MTSRKRAASDLDTELEGDKRAVLKHPRTDIPSATLTYPSLSQTSPRAVPFQRPLPLISFSYNKGRELEFSDAAMRYYVDPPPGADLGFGYDRWVRRPEEKGRLDGLLRAISEARRRKASDSVIGVISWRGIMTKCVQAVPPRAPRLTESAEGGFSRRRMKTEMDGNLTSCTRMRRYILKNSSVALGSRRSERFFVRTSIQHIYGVQRRYDTPAEGADVLWLCIRIVVHRVAA